MKKGLRPAANDVPPFCENLNLALMKKGLKHRHGIFQALRDLFKPCPDEEGIKTLAECPTIPRDCI